MRPVVFIGDVHLDRGHDAEIEAFVGFLERLASTSSRVILMGDLFNVWIGRRDLEGAHHVPVIEALARLRGAGVVVRYLEGNRDYRIAQCYAGTAVDDSTPGGIVEEFGGHRVYAVHGDLANTADRQYRAWRRFSRSRLAWTLFHLVPRARRRRFADSLEARLRGTNLDFKREFPETMIRGYARSLLERGHDAVVLGHFHLERELAIEKPAGRVFVLPLWTETRRHLELRESGEIVFVDST
ncbi:MAG: hypothetical protein GY716_01225 [bacterium]|nr:hypothetical protein [bacterium]